MATFKTRARTLDMLGRQQIAGIPTAISELFKNAHDAYADHVEIDYYRSDNLFVLRDDGIGMSHEDFVASVADNRHGEQVRFHGSQRPPQIWTRNGVRCLARRESGGSRSLPSVRSFWCSRVRRLTVGIRTSRLHS